MNMSIIIAIITIIVITIMVIIRISQNPTPQPSPLPTTPTVPCIATPAPTSKSYLWVWISLVALIIAGLIFYSTNDSFVIGTNKVVEEKKVVMEVSISGSPAAQGIVPLPPGEYSVFFTPNEATTRATFVVFIKGVGAKSKKIENNLISVKGGEEAIAIWTAIPSVAKIRSL